MELESFPLPSNQPLAEAYCLQSDSRIAGLFGGHPSDEGVWQARSAYLREQRDSRVPAESLARVLLDYNRRFGSEGTVAQSIESIAQGASVIVGGQQAGLWTGPLLVIHKAVTIIQAAKHAEARVGQPVVPVFWIAGEDHDWEEANHAYIQADAPRKIAIAHPGGAKTSVSRTKLTAAEMKAALQELAAVLPDTPNKQPMLAMLQATADGSATLTDWFAHVLTHLFGEHGLVLLDADDPALRKLESDMFRTLIERGGELEGAYRQAGAAIRSLGYKVQAESAEGCANLFLFHGNPADGGQERTLLYRREGEFANRRGTVRLTADELIGIAEQAPERLSNNVLTRPLMQDYVLPVLATVLGQGEIAYWAQTSESFRLLGMEMPIIVPRMSFTLVEPHLPKQMDKYSLGFNEVIERYAAKRQAWLDEREEWAIGEKFGKTRAQFEELYAPLIELVSSLEPGLGRLGDTNRERILREIAYLEQRAKDAHERRFDAALRQMDRVAHSLWPGGKPQERVLNAMQLYNQYGVDWIKRLLEAPFEPDGRHRLVYL
ncbi:bacillithiol biosynthesis cysteine-adding enzyme BshC [Paenibacillus methanolicus]|uniref:Putative cysteine ligase BshC n=1 Tax=Paenibacillus methanolicus TaxID=582686 RepID=A0A5S5CF93_9BACL|nr:bacillithiol biosynthesis cysteine-adding enzyme BshC [Paenibacillus methanolicus]TYP77967.1 bacillithiol biosynthesis cysteine-adding enzyme BshC [Paenibacillus methanolicus]